MLREDIAIIGISGLYPDAEDLRQFHLNLSNGIDSVGDVSAERKRLAGLEPSAVCHPVATLDRIDEFDHSFFNISLREAENMDPHQRLLLQLAVAAIEDAGYSTGELKGSRTAVIISASVSDYGKSVEQFDPTALTGNLPAAFAGRIAYILDLRGPAMVIDTACSSSLAAVYEAYKQICYGEVDCAIAGGVTLFLFQGQGEGESLGIAAPDGKSKAFDASANGAGWGEGGGLVMLKPLKKALADRDHIYAVIKGGAVNQDGSRSNGLAAPSPEAQRDVILQAWKNSAIDPQTISLIEAHGTGTELGDPIEIHGITEAFREYTSRKKFCAISSVKTNIGHLGGAAGIAGLTKLVLSLKHRKLFSSLHFVKPNPYIDFDNAPVYVNTHLRDWEIEEAAQVRRAGISSFGLSGTNAHMVLEEAPAIRPVASIEPEHDTLITLSARTESSLLRYAFKLREFLKENDNSLSDIAYTLNKGRDDHAYRLAYVVKSKQELINALEATIIGQDADSELKACEKDAQVVFLFSSDAVDKRLSRELAENYPAYQEVLNQCSSLTHSRSLSIHEELFAFQYALYTAWLSLGLSTGKVVGAGRGNLPVSVITGKRTLEQAILEASSFADRSDSFDRLKLKNALLVLSEKTKPIFVEVGTGGMLSREIRNLNGELGNLIAIDSLVSSAGSLLNTLSVLYVNGVSINWDKYYEGQKHHRAQLPTYCFEKTSCWIRGHAKRLELTAPVTAPIDETPAEIYGLLTDEQASDTQKKIAVIWGNVLKIEALNGDEDFFDLGGNSLNGTQVVTRIEEDLGVEIAFEDIYDYSTIKTLAGYIDDLRPSKDNALEHTLDHTRPPIIPIENAKNSPLSFGQQRLWFLDQFEPGSPLYNITNALMVDGPLNVELVERSINAIVRRHDVLRATFHNVDGGPLQLISPSLTLTLPVIDLSQIDERQMDERLRTLITEEANDPFDLASGPLFRVKLLRLQPAKHIILYTMHHIVSDGWSMGIVIREFGELYRAYSRGEEVRLAPLPVQYADYAYWQREWLKGEELERQLSYWKKQLGEGEQVLELATDRARPSVASNRGARKYIEIEAEVAARLREVSRQQSATMYMVLLSGYEVMLSRYSGQEEISVGTAIANRGRVEVEGLIGFFVNTLVMRTDLSGDPSVKEVLRRVKEVTLGGYAHQDVPFEMLVDELQPERSLSHSPLFQTMFIFQNTPSVLREIDGLISREMEVYTGVSKFDLSMLLAENNSRLVGWVEYNTDLFESSTIERMIERFKRVLEAMATDTTQKISQIMLLSAKEQQQMIVEWNQTAKHYDERLCAHEMIEMEAQRNGEAVAIEYERERINYRELNERANRLGNYLRSRGIGEEDVVAICVERSIEMVVGMLGILKSGAAYAPMDPGYPSGRLEYMMGDSGARMVVTQESLEARIGGSEAEIVSIDREWEKISKQSETKPRSEVRPDNLAYVIYTSGSTGEPKGVCIEHRQLLNYVNGIEERLEFGDVKSFATVSTLAADLGNTVIFPALCRGKTLHIISPDRIFDAERLADYFTDHRIDCLKIVPSHLEALLAATHPQRVLPMKRLILGGEASSRDLIERLKKLPAQCDIFNHYGPTETTIGVLTYRYDKERDANSPSVLPVGRPIPNAQVYLLDSNMQPVAVGMPGEIFIGGAGLARCYLNRADSTAESFIPNPFISAPGSRLYKTGDIGRYGADGNIEFIGRADDQVKIRGNRIELNEIKVALNQHPAIRESVIVARKDANGHNRVIAYFVKNESMKVEEPELREWIGQKLPEYMQPFAFVLMKSIPLTGNGKLDRKALPAPEEIYARANPAFKAPSNRIERLLAGIWSELLDVERVGTEDNFFRLGGDSLTSIRLVTRLNQAGLHVSPKQVFKHPTIASLARAIEPGASIESGQMAESNAPPLRPVSRDQDMPLSFAQQRLWFIDQLDPLNATYNIPAAIRLIGKLNVAALEASFNAIIERHEALRTRIETVSGKPVQVIDKAEAVRVPVADLESMEQGQEEATRLAEQEAGRGFDLSRGPLVRVMLIKVGEQDHILIVNMHHIVSDRWSRSIAIREFGELYRAYSTGEADRLAPLPVQYADYAYWQREWLKGEELERQLSYWKKQLGEGEQVLELATDRARPSVASNRGARKHIEIEAEIAARLREVSRQQSATMYMVLLSGYEVMLSRYSGQEEISVGTAIANRGRVEVEGLIGFFVNTLVMRTDLSGDPTFNELLSRVRNVVLNAMANQDLPFDYLVEQLEGQRSLSYSPLFQVAFIFQNIDVDLPKIAELEMKPLNVENRTAKFDLTLEMVETENGIAGAFEYSTDIFDPATIERMASHFKVLLESVSANAHHRLSELQMLTAAEQYQLLTEWNEVKQTRNGDRCIHQLFEAQAERMPDAAAVSFGSQRMTYGELNRRANQLANYLRRLGVGPDICVGICAEPSIEMIVGLLGILKAGGAYVPLEPSLPKDRIAFILEDSQIELLLTQDHLAGRLLEYNRRLVCVDSDAMIATESTLRESFIEPIPENLAYVIYTSGSTGKPKGVLVTHSNLARLLAATDCWFHFNDQDVWTMFHSFAFDFSVWEMWGALAYGGRLVVVAHHISRAADAFYQLLLDESVTVLNQTPSAFRQLINAQQDEQGHAQKLNLRLVIFGGEALDLQSLRGWAARNGVDRPRLVNMYGITETTVHVTYQPLSLEMIKHSHKSLIGERINDLRVYALDEQLKPVPVGVSGELYVGGEGLARGYQRRSDLTAERFIPDAYASEAGKRLYKTGDRGRWQAEGVLEYAGRKDEQVKIRGYRIELGEIEGALTEQEEIEAAVVIVSQEDGGEKRLIGYVEKRAGAEAGEREIKRKMRERVPEYMVPSAIVIMERLPLTVNGKVDRRKLPRVEEGKGEKRQGQERLRTATEEIIGNIWGELLRREDVGIEENFFDLGGHSLLAMQVMSRAREIFRTEMPLRTVFEAPTVAGFAESIETAIRAGQSLEAPPLKPAPPDARRVLSFMQQRMWFINRFEPDDPSYNVTEPLRIRGRLNVAMLEQAFNEVVRRHDVLRTTIGELDGEPVVTIHSAMPCPVPVADLAELPTAAKEAQVQMLATQESRRPFDLSRGPILRVLVLSLGQDEYAAFLVMHHIACDGWSLAVLVQEVAQLYRAYYTGTDSELPEPVIHYSDYAVWQRQWLQDDVLQNKLDYWKKQLAGAPPLLDLPTDRPRPPVQSSTGEQQTFELPRSMVESLRRLSRQNQVTLFMTMLGAFEVLLYRYSGQQDIVVGSPVSGRDRLEVERVIGSFLNNLVLRVDLSGDPSFIELLARVREVVIEAQVYQDLPFEKLVDELQPERNLSYSPLFQVMFTLKNQAQFELKMDFPGLTVSLFEIQNGISKFDLVLVLTETTDDIKGSLQYNTALWEKETISRMITHYATLLDRVVENPAKKISSLEILSDAEKQQILRTFNETTKNYDTDRCLHDLIEQQAALSNEAIALMRRHEKITYKELNERANRLGNYLRAKGVRAEQAVAICVERSIEMVVGMLGIMKAGAAYVPLDPEYPEARLNYVLENARVNILITQERLRRYLPRYEGEVICLDRDWSSIAAESSQNPQAQVLADNLAYIIYTSGSTGKPKGVAISHRSAVTLTCWAREAFSPEELRCVLASTSICFDLSVFELMVPLSCSGKVLIAENALTLAQLAAANEVTLINTVPSAMRELVNSGGVPESVITVNLAGEPLRNDLAQQIYGIKNVQRVMNLYGPTEDTTYTTWEEVIKGANQEPNIGRPIANTEIYILDENFRPVPAGVYGELCIAGEGLARCYLNQPDMTAEKFLPNPYSLRAGARLYRTGDVARHRVDGNIEYKGRADHQVKIRGFRIEPGEIEIALNQHLAIADAVIVTAGDTSADKRLVAYFVPRPGDSPAPEELRRYLGEKLPEYMLPSVFIALTQIPLTPNGKLDRLALPSPDYFNRGAANEYAPPRNHIEETLCRIWSEVLPVDEVGIYDNFFELGGDSILSLQIIARANNAGIKLVPKQLFKQQTIAQLAASASTSFAQAEQRLVTGKVPLTPVQEMLFERELAHPYHWNQALMLQLGEAMEPPVLKEALRHLLVHHDSLRARFERRQSTWEQVFVGPDLEVPLIQADLSQLSDVEQAAAIENMAGSLQSSLDLCAPPLIRAAIFELGDQKQPRLLIIIHHLIVDGVSWRVLIEDLQTAYSSLKAGQPVRLPSKTTSFKDWAERLIEHSRSESPRSELDYWLSEPRRHIHCLPVDYQGGVNSEASARAITMHLTAEETSILLQKGPATHNIQVGETLLAALSQTITQWSGYSSLLVDAEGHGREGIFDDLDLSRTVGWFTSIYSMLLETSDCLAPAETLTSIKEQVRSVPHNGINYGVLRYLGDDAVVKEMMRAYPRAEMSFNYLGQFDQTFSGSLSLAMESKGPSRSLRDQRQYLLDVSGAIVEKQLWVTWVYSENIHRTDTIEGLAHEFMAALKLFIAHFQSPEASEYAESSLALTGVADQELDRLLEIVEFEE